MNDTAFFYLALLRRILATAAALRMIACRACDVYPPAIACLCCKGARYTTPREAIQLWPFPADRENTSRVFLEFRSRPPVGLDEDSQQEAAATIAWMILRAPEGLSLAASMLEAFERANPAGFIYERIADGIAVLQEKDRG